MADATTPAASSKHDVSMLVFPPIVHAVWGIVLLAGFFLGMMMQIQSTEAWMLGETSHALMPDLSVFAQFPDFFSRHMSPAASVAFLVAWAVELTYITIKIGTARPQAHIMRKYGAGIATSDAIVRSATVRAGIWSIVSWLIFAFNAWTDWQYATMLGGWQQVVFILVTGVVTFFFGTLGIQQVVIGMSKMAN